MLRRNLVVCLLLLWSPAIAQYDLTLTGHRGHLLAHRPLVEGLRQDPVRGVDLSVSHRTRGQQDWHHAYNFPTIGLYAGFWNLGNREKLGSATALIPYIDFPLIGNGQSGLTLQFGWGMGFMEKKFDAENNYKNTAIGSRFNNALLLHPKYRFALMPSLDMSLGISLTHYSNGSYETPNLGINMASFTLGLTGKFYKDTIPSPQRQTIAREQTAEWLLFGSVFAKEVAPADGKKYGVATLMTERLWRRTPKISFGVGGDVFLNGALVRRDNYNADEGITELIRSGIHGTLGMHVGKTMLILSMGGYVYSGIVGESFYHRFGLRYRLSERWLACMHVKSHWGKADFMEFGVARSWKRSNTKKQLN
ncbi:MAG: acyloxyacyl hydrolase [Bacteroidia bacterium]